MKAKSNVPQSHTRLYGVIMFLHIVSCNFGDRLLAGLRLTVFTVATLCVLTSASTVLAQETPPAKASEAPVPKKSNARPAPTQASQSEPFDNATVEKMAGHCVKLETEAGVIEIEMLAEAAPENV